MDETKAQVHQMLGPESVQDLEALREKFGARLIGITDGKTIIGRVGGKDYAGVKHHRAGGQDAQR